MKVVAHKLTKKSVFMVLLIGMGTSLMTFSLVMGVLSIFGFETIHVNGESIIGLNGLLSALLMGASSILGSVTSLWLCIVFGLWVYSHFGNLNIEFVEVKKHEKEGGTIGD